MLRLFVKREMLILQHVNLAITLCLVILLSTEELEGENNGCRAGSRGVCVLV